jgi:HEAT repeat protein
MMRGVSDASSETDPDIPDVREHLAELLKRREPSTDDVEWGRFRHAYGPAEDVPGLLQGLYDQDPARASRNLSTLWNRVRHQGGSSAPAALAVPFLLRAVSQPGVHHRSQLLLLAADAGHRNYYGGDRRQDMLRVEDPPDQPVIDGSGHPVGWALQAARTAITAGVPLLTGLLDDPDPTVRAHAAYALATAAPPPPAARNGLLARMLVEREPSVRMSLVLAVTQLALEHGDGSGIVAWTADRWTGDANPDDVRLAGALAWLCATSDPPPTTMLTMLTAQAGKRAEQWLKDVPWIEDIEYRGGFAAWLASFLGDAPQEQARFTAVLSANHDAHVATSACLAAYELAEAWRSHTGTAIELLADAVGHSEQAVRVAAARLLARAGTVEAEIADRVAAALDDDDLQTRAWAAVTLAHRGDARAVAPLAELLTRTQCPWPSTYRRFAVPPERLLDHLEPYANELMPAVLQRLTRVNEQSWCHVRGDLLHGLATWHDRAADAAGTLIALLTNSNQDRPTIATIIGRIGPAATAAVPVIDELSVADPDLRGVLAWARWRITGERTAQTAATLARFASTPPHGPTALRLLADLGPAAAPHIPLIRAMLNDSYEWVQAEAALALWRCTGDTADTLPALLRVLDDHPWLPLFAPVHSVVVECLGDIGPPAEPAAPVLKRYLQATRRQRTAPLRYDPISWDERGQHLATSALNRIRPPGRVTQVVEQARPAPTPVGRRRPRISGRDQA